MKNRIEKNIECGLLGIVYCTFANQYTLFLIISFSFLTCYSSTADCFRKNEPIDRIMTECQKQSHRNELTNTITIIIHNISHRVSSICALELILNQIENLF